MLPQGTEGGGLMSGDETLAAAFARNPVVTGLILTPEGGGRAPLPKAGFAYGGTDPTSYLPNQPAAVPLVARSGDILLPSLAVESLRVAQGAGSVLIRSADASGEAGGSGTAMTALRVGAFEAQTGPDGTAWVYYSGMPELKRISAWRLLEDDAADTLRPAVEGHIVLVGTSAAGLRDLVVTPLGDGVPGVDVHAEVIDQIMSGTSLARADWAFGAEITAGLVVAYGSATALGFLAVDRERRFLRRALGQYLSPPLVDRLASDPRHLKLGGEVRDLTVLFTDIRGFSSLSEGLEPEALTLLLNDFLTPMTDVLLRDEATIDKYMGDAIMAFWNAPLPTERHPRQACLSALRMLDELAALNSRTGRTLRIGIGLNSGPCCVGNLGSQQRFSYSAIGDAVNVASRVEGLTKQYGVSILVTEDTAREAADLALLEVDLVRVVGRTEPVAIHALVGGPERASEPEFQRIRALQARFIAAYRGRRFDEAGECLDEMRKLGAPELEGLRALYARRLEIFGLSPPEEGWDGVFEAQSK